MISQTEFLPEAPIGETLMEHFMIVRLGLLLTSHQKRIALLDPFDFVQPKSRNSHADAILVLTVLFDVIRRPFGLGRCRAAHQKTDQNLRWTETGAQIIGSHNHI